MVAKKSRKKANPTNQPLRGALCCSTKRAQTETRLKPQTSVRFIAFGLRCSAGQKGVLSASFCCLLLFGCHTRPDLVSMVVCCVASRRAWVDSSVKHWNDNVDRAPAPTAFCQAEQRS